MKTGLVAPCGLNCSVCSAFLREKNKCPGCMAEGKSKLTHRETCKIKNCCISSGFRYCLECGKYPCVNIKRINKRYLEKYKTDLKKNLEEVKNLGEKMFLEKEGVKWQCQNCKGVVSIHSRKCVECGKNCDI